MFINLKPAANGLRQQSLLIACADSCRVPGATLFFAPRPQNKDIRMGGRAGNADINTPCNPTIWNCYAPGKPRIRAG